MTDRVYSHILVPTDFDPDRRAAYRVALAAANGSGAVVTLLHVAALPAGEAEDEYRGLDAIRLMHRSAGSWGGWRPSPEAVAAENAELEGRLRAELPAHTSGAVRVRVVVRRGEVAAEVRRFVRESGVDLVVVADSPHGWLPVFGRGLADRIAGDAAVEVVRVRPAPAAVRPRPAVEVVRVTPAGRGRTAAGAGL